MMRQGSASWTIGRTSTDDLRLKIGGAHDGTCSSSGAVWRLTQRAQGIMLEVAGGLGFDLHGVTGVLAIFLMVIHVLHSRAGVAVRGMSQTLESSC